MQACSPGCLAGSLSLLAAEPHASAGSAGAAEALYQAVADLAVLLLGPGARTSAAAAGGEDQDAAVAVAAMELLVSLCPTLRHRASTAGVANASAALAAAAAWLQVAGALAERNLNDVATGPASGAADAPSLRLATAVLELVSAGCGPESQLRLRALARLSMCVQLSVTGARCPVRVRRRPCAGPLAEGAVDFFLALNTTPVAERHPALRQPLFAALTPFALRSAVLPASVGPSGWEQDVAEDEEAFNRWARARKPR